MSIDLDRLLAWAGQGFHVFPLSRNSKLPIKGTDGLLAATTDPATVRAWHHAHPGANWAVNCGRSGLAVVDVDTKHSDGHAALFDLEMDRGALPETLRVRTPSGGAHIYFMGEAATSASKLAKGVDTRGGSRDGEGGGYVLLPGSSLDGKTYAVEVDAPIAPLPEWVRTAAGAPAARVEHNLLPVVELDRPAATALALAFAQRAEPAVEGCGGDLATYRVAARMKDFGVSEPAALELLLEHFNPRCSPPWEPEALATKVASAFAYGQNAPGILSPEAAFQPVPADQRVAAPAEPTPARDFGAVTADTFDAMNIPPRPWILGHRLIAGFVTGTVAAGGAGKTTLSVLEALSVASGMNLTGDKPTRTGGVWLYNTEDPLDELQRRVVAAAVHHRVPKEALARVHVSSGRSYPLTVARSDRSGITVEADEVAAVIAFIKERHIIAVVVDPFVHTHFCDENSNAEMAQVLLQFAKVAEATGASVNLVHHTSKGAGVEGNMEKARGASAFGGAVRVMHTMVSMSEDEAAKWKVDKAKRKWFVRLDDAKGNMSPPDDEVRWFRKVSVTLPSGDAVGTIEPAQLQRVVSEDLAPTRDAVIDRAKAGQYLGHWSTIDEVVEDLKRCDLEGVFKGMQKKSIAKLVVEAFDGAPVYVDGHGVQVKLSNRDGRWELTAEPCVKMIGEEDEKF